MLVQFNISNFCSISDTQTLSMVAGSNKELESANILNAWKGKGLRLLPYATIYEPNAAGKSNIINALGAV